MGLHYIVQGWLEPTLGGQLITVGVADLLWAAPVLILLGCLPLDRLLGGLPEPLPEGVTMSLRSPSVLHRPLAIAATAMLVLPRWWPGPSRRRRPTGTRIEKISERADIDQQLEDLRIDLGGVNDDLADTYMALAETELLIPQAQQDLEDAQAELEAAQENDREIGERLTAAQDEEELLSGQVESGRDEVDSSDEELSQIAMDAYKGGGMPSPSSVYIGGGSPQDTVDRSMNYQPHARVPGQQAGHPAL